MTELKPCPFCDGEIETKDFDFIASHLYRCKECKSGFILQPVTGFSAEDVWNMKNTKYFPSEVQQAVERMKPKRVVCRHFNKYYGNEIGDCPNCLCTIEDESELNEHPHCKYCGQALDWSE